MLSTFLSYDLVNRDFKSQLERVGSSNQVAREEAYYKENIGKVTSVEEFLDDYRLYSYAMKAHGLEDMTYAKAFMKKVLESDLTDTGSFANLLTDDRYKNFAAAFRFTSDTATIQTTGQTEDVIDNFKAMRQGEIDKVATETAYFEANIGSVTSVDDLLLNERMRNFVLEAFELDTKYWNKDYLTKILTSDTSDPNSYVNTLGGPNQPALVAFADAFNFNASGTLDGGVSVQNADQTHTVVQAYTFNVPSFMIPAAAEMNKEYFESKIGSVTNVDDIINDARMLDYVKVAYGLEDVTLKSTIRNILTSDLSDPGNYATTFGGAAYEALASAFNFETDGSLAGGNPAQSLAQTTGTVANYYARYDDSQQEEDDKLYSLFEKRIGLMTSVKDLQGNSQIYDFVLMAFGFDPNTVSDREIAKALKSDLTDPKSFVNTSRDPRYKELASAFNFDTDGNITAPLLAQSQATMTNMAKDYVILKTRFGNEDQKDSATAESTYYTGAMQDVKTLDEFLSDRRLVKFALESKGIDPTNITATYLKELFTSDLDDPDSVINQQDDHRYIELVASYNFDTEGNIALRETGIQGRLGQMNTEYLFLQQSLEEEVGEDNAGARLALYFKRMMPSVNSAYDILGDSALLEVFRTAFSLPDEMSAMDIDKQKAIVDKYMDLEELQDPDKLEKFIGRFTAMYDLENDTNSNPVLSLFSSPGTISADTLLSIAQLKR